VLAKFLKDLKKYSAQLHEDIARLCVQLLRLPRYLSLNHGLSTRKEVPRPIVYRDVKLDHGYRIDLLVDTKVVIEVLTMFHEGLVRRCKYSVPRGVRTRVPM
jgi:hypothetical protein